MIILKFILSCNQRKGYKSELLCYFFAKVVNSGLNSKRLVKKFLKF